MVVAAGGGGGSEEDEVEDEVEEEEEEEMALGGCSVKLQARSKRGRWEVVRPAHAISPPSITSFKPSRSFPGENSAFPVPLGVRVTRRRGVGV